MEAQSTKDISATRSLARGAALVAGVVAACTAAAQTVPFAGVPGDSVLNALAQECYEAGMVSEMPSDAIMDCSVVLDERSTGAPPFDRDSAAEGAPDEARDVVVVRHKIRFTLLEQGDEPRVRADAWTETEELGTAIETPITADEYTQRVRDVLTDVVARLRAAANAAPAWAARYESEQAWHLDAHLRAVRHCDANLERFTAETVRRDLVAVGIRPLSVDTRDRCEQLYTQLFEWGLMRGNDAPTVEDYARHRAALPAEQRACSGRLALDATCR